MTPLVAFTMAWALGIVLAQAALFSQVWLLLALPTALVLHFGWQDDTRARLAVWALLGLLLGAGRFLLVRSAIDEQHVARYNGADIITVTGVVVGEPDRRTLYTNLRVAAEEVSFAGGETFPVHGQVLVKASVYTPAFYGDRIRARGALETPPAFEGFSYREYLARQHIYSLLRRADVVVLEAHQANRLLETLFRFKAHALHTLLAVLPEPQASLLAGILLGVESGIPQDLNDAFSATGTSHIVAISGFNLTLIAGVLAAFARRAFGKKGELPVALAGVWLYTLLVGASAAVVRAAVMGSLAILARRENRPLHGPTSLAVAALAMSAHNPLVLWDVGFQLSLAATAGLIFFTDPLTALFLRGLGHFTNPEQAERVVGWLSDALIVTLAAQITTQPIILAKFQRLSLVTLLTNFLILPAQPFVMLCGGATLLAALLFSPLGQIVGWSAWVFLTYTIEVVRWTAEIPFASVPIGRIALPLVWGYYLLLAGAMAWFSRPRMERQRWLCTLRGLASWQRLGGLVILVLAGAYFLTLPDGKLHLFFLDVGQGDAVFVQLPDGRQLLIDGGPDSTRLLSQLGQRMPFWDRQLDLVILTSPDDERLAGLVPVLERYQVELVAAGPEEGHGSSYDRWRELLSARPQEAVGTLWAGSVWDLGDGVTLHTLWPEPAGVPGPLVLQLRYGDVKLLLAGDATTVVEENLVAVEGEELRSNVLQVARHGATTSSTPAFLQAVAPEIAVISVGKDNRYGDPAPAVLARLLDEVIYRTDRHGTVEVISDGAKVWVRTEQ